MRDFYLGLNQKEVLELQDRHTDKTGRCQISTDDLILIRRIVDLTLSSKSYSVMIEKKVYHWVNYNVILEDLPMIFSSIHMLKKRVEKLKNLGIIENKKHSVTKNEAENGDFKVAGTYSVVRLSDEAKKLFDSNRYGTEVVKGYGTEVVKGYGTEVVNKEYHENNIHEKKQQQEKHAVVDDKKSKGNPVIRNEISMLIRTHRPSLDLDTVIRKSKGDVALVKKHLLHWKDKDKGDGFIMTAIEKDWNIEEQKPKEQHKFTGLSEKEYWDSVPGFGINW